MLAQVKESFDYLVLLPLETAAAFFQALCPLFAIQDAFRDSLILVLRKSMFAKLVMRLVSLWPFEAQVLF